MICSNACPSVQHSVFRKNAQINGVSQNHDVTHPPWEPLERNPCKAAAGQQASSRRTSCRQTLARRHWAASPAAAGRSRRGTAAAG